MKKIALIRVDDRLMHGQVVVSWIPYLKVDEVLIIDDEYATDEFMTLLIKSRIILKYIYYPAARR